MSDKQPKTTNRPHRRGAKTRWLWLPSLMFGDGVAVSVLVLTMVMLRRMGLDTADTALAIALLSLPVLLRPLFEMVVTHFWGTTKVWILSTQFISALSLAAVAFTLHTSSWLLGTVCFMPFFVCSSVFYNIALHRFYVDSPTPQISTPQHHNINYGPPLRLRSDDDDSWQHGSCDAQHTLFVEPCVLRYSRRGAVPVALAHHIPTRWHARLRQAEAYDGTASR